MSTPQQFALDVSAFAQKARLNMHAAVRKIVLDIGSRVVLRSPVGDPSRWAGPAPKGYTGGRFRANWQYSTIAPMSGVLGVVDKTGKVSLDRIRTGMPKEAAGKVHWIVNNLPYAARLETGWSKQAPGGMVGLVVREYQGIVAKAAKEVLRGGQ